MTGKELIDKIKDLGLEPMMFHENSFYEVLGGRDWDQPREVFDTKRENYFKHTGIGSWTEVATKGGGEGDGEEFYSVIHFIDHNIYLRVNGYYYSYDGINNADTYFEVFPEQVTITVYNEK